jgi:hypothetical protein
MHGLRALPSFLRGEALRDEAGSLSRKKKSKNNPMQSGSTAAWRITHSTQPFDTSGQISSNGRPSRNPQ